MPSGLADHRRTLCTPSSPPRQTVLQLLLSAILDMVVSSIAWLFVLPLETPPETGTVGIMLVGA